ncbi:GAF and ANTAR domain-containing protein [Streptomonospora sp. PA3]|uniref:GAF and ANTAR domain-containing protein n=1 Tax=Streptomonospora sp. PA3 TaxID=2607326 RepID=UPI0012DE8B32|nr:GAF and ANTAR domain-containing protein [Streptomonospora sp. PA3]MUL40288.1 GAF and ANTAR domain-containing protein [Streptomonospora sp. PA3]
MSENGGGGRLGAYHRLFADMARELFSRDSTEEVLERIVEMAVEAVDGCEEAGILLIDRRNRRFETPAATSDLVRASDRAQLECDEGPCLDASRQEQSFRVDDLAEESRWPCYRPRALDLGIRSMLGFELYTHEDNLGALDLYSRSPNAFGEDARQIGWVFASHAAVAIAGAQREATLREGYATRQEIGEAVGIIMERKRITSDEAFGVLRTASMNSNTKLRDIARRTVETGEIPGE